MKLVINVDGVKRTIHEDFSICGSKKDFETLISCITQGLSEGFSYGWIDIRPQIRTGINESPYDWGQEAK